MIFSQRTNANDPGTPCNVSRGANPPLNAKNCTPLYDGTYLITPCSDSISQCVANKSDIEFGVSCGSKSPSTPTPQDLVNDAIEKTALDNPSRVKVISSIEKLNDETKSPDPIYLYNLQGIQNTEKLENLIVSKNHLQDRKYAKQQIAQHSASGWIAIRRKDSRLLLENAASIIPKCKTANTSANQFP
jgi:hypothetical protein